MVQSFEILMREVREVGMTTAYVVKAGEKYFCSAEDGDIGLAPEIREAKHFLSREEAEEVATRHADSGYEIVTIDVPER